MLFTTKIIFTLTLSILLGYLNSVRTEIPFFTPPETPEMLLFEKKNQNLPEGVQGLTVRETHLIFKKNTHIFVDARLPKIFKKNHIEFAENLPIHNSDEHLSPFLDKYPFETPLVLYCGSINCDSSTRLATELKNTGYKNIKVFLGGWAEWHKIILKK